MLTDAGASGKSLSGRPALAAALDLVQTGGADVLAVSKLDRFSRSLLDFAGLMARAHRNGWALVSNVMASVAEWEWERERETIGARTKFALAARRAQVVRLGRPRTLPLEVLKRISRERAEGRTLRAVANGLTDDAVPDAQGGVWRPGTEAAFLSSQDAQPATASVRWP